MRALALTLTGLTTFCIGLVSLEGCKPQCDVGSEGCECTTGGACNPGLTCLSKLCVNAGPNPDELGDESGDDTNTDAPGDGDPGDGDPGDGDGDTGGPKLDSMNETDTDTPCSETGCKKVDMLFALDGSLSMIE